MLLLFFGIATTAGDIGLVGSYGKEVAEFNIKYFGYTAYAYPFLLIWPLFRLYMSFGITLARLEAVTSTLLFFCAILIIQSFFAPPLYTGAIGGGVVEFLRPFIGIAGVVLLLATTVLLAFMVAFDVSFAALFQKIYDAFAKVELPKPKPKEEPKQEVKPEKKNEIESFLESQTTVQDTTQGDGLDEFLLDETDYSDKIKIIKSGDLEPQEPKNEPQKDVLVPLITEQKEEPKILKLSDAAPKNEEPPVKSSFEIVKELEENQKLLSQIELGGTKKPKGFMLPRLDFLSPPKETRIEVDEAEIDEKIKDLLDKLHRFKIEGDVVRTYAGPVVTTFEFKPAPHVKVSRILTLEDDLAMALKAKTIRIQAPIPGKDVIGIEIPNHHVETIYLREVLESEIFQNSSSPLTLALGKDIVGRPFVTDLKKLPHLLIAGTTGSGKSVGINAMILSLLYKNSPDNLRLLMVDPKMLEFSIYNEIPHLLTPVITKPKQACSALNNMVGEMERRYALMSKYKVKNIENYNEKAQKESLQPLPYIVVIIDELADLMMTSGKEVEYSIARLAQMARASGIHLIVATQRPSVDVVTGLIKANLPSRVSYKVGQKIDSKVILDGFGAEALLGRGDMLFTPPGMSGLVRLHAPWSSEDEIEKIVDFLKAQRGVNYDESFLSEDSENGFKSAKEPGMDSKELDDMYDEAKNIVLTERKTSISYIQRRLQIGYNRAANIVEQLQQMGVLSSPDNKGNREIVGG